jgi:LCP family protein required for cell wall assembly
MKTTLKRGTGRNGSANGHATLPPLPPLTPVTRYGPPRRSRLRLLGRILAILVLCLLVSLGALAGGFWLYLNESVSAVNAHTPEAIAAEEALDVPLPGEPTVAMVIGFDKRPDEARGTASRSDTIMLIRIDPDREAVSMLSFPRDLSVEIPGCQGQPPFVGRINEAFTACGRKGSLETVKQLTGIPVNYLIAVNFEGFQDIVDDMGGVYMDVERRYFNDNAGLGYGQTYDRIDLHPGYQRLNGVEALDYVRYRHTDSDLYRNARQQQFVKAFKQQVSTFSSVTKIPAIVRTITQNVEVSVGGGETLDFGTVYGYARLLYELPSGAFQQTRLEGLDEVPGTYLLQASSESVDVAVERFLHPDPGAAEKAAAAATGTKPKLDEEGPVGPPPTQVSIEVLNGNGVAGSADEAAFLLGERGYEATNGGNADAFDHFETTIQYSPTISDAELAAKDLADLFVDATVEKAPAQAPLQTTVRVIVGQTFHGTLAPPRGEAPPPRQKPTVSPDTTTAAALAPVARRLDFPVLAPSMIQSGAHVSTLEGVRAYKVNGEDALRITYQSPNGIEYWGIQQTAWTDAPILQGASVTKTIDGREYQLFFSGTRLHLVAFEENGAAYWVVNTLLDSMSNETMLAIAKGLKPVRP